MNAAEKWAAGNIDEDTTETRGWLVGFFIDPTKGVRSTSDVEVKWAHHPNCDTRTEWTAGDHRTTLVILIDGHFRVDLTEGGRSLEKSGDYIMWGPGIDHSWTALAESIVLTVRWPSTENSG